MGLIRHLVLAALAPAAFAMLAASANADSPPRGDGDFRVIVEDVKGRDGTGVFGAVDTAGADVLGTQDGADAFSSYISVRSYTTGTDYVQTTQSPASGFFVAPLDPYGSVEAIDGGWQASYAVPESSLNGEALTVVTEISSPASAGGGLLLSAEVTNHNSYPVSIGVRFLLDVAAGVDDGPLVAADGSGSTSEREVDPTAEITLTSGPGAQLEIASPPLPGGRSPDAIRVAHWNRAFESAFDFETEPIDVSSDGGVNDSALLYYFGANEASAITLAPEGSVRLSLVISIQSAPDTPTPPASVTPSPAPPSAPATSSPPSLQASPTAVTPFGQALPNTGGPFANLGGDAAPFALAGAALIAAALALAYQLRARRPHS